MVVIGDKAVCTICQEQGITEDDPRFLRIARAELNNRIDLRCPDCGFVGLPAGDGNCPNCGCEMDDPREAEAEGEKPKEMTAKDVKEAILRQAGRR